MAIRLGGRASLVEEFPANFLAGVDYILGIKRRGVNVRIINVSFGGPWIPNQAMRDAFTALGNADILAVCAAMNEALDVENHPYAPAALQSPAVISVAASTESDALAGFSNFGRNVVDLAAPGVNLSTTWGSSAYRTNFGPFCF